MEFINENVDNMSKFSCRGKEKRIQLVKIYEIKPISHMILLNGQEKRSAAEDKITKEYYCFSYKKKNSNEKTDTFIVGIYVAKHFLELLNYEPLPNDPENELSLPAHTLHFCYEHATVHHKNSGDGLADFHCAGLPVR